jgi:hypothetical protein
MKAISPAGNASDDAVVAATKRWIERAVIGLNLCPFARAPYLGDRLRLHVSHATTPDALIADLCDELSTMQERGADTVETTLLIHPFVFTDFLAFNDFLEAADGALEALELDGEIQLASFHPDYQFADTAADDVENCTNRSPYPILHLLRESSVDRAVATLPDTDAIYRRNIETLRSLGHEGWRKLWLDDARG